MLPGTDGAAWLVMPTTFDIERPGSWFQEEVLPRIERKQERLLWNLTWQGGARKPAATPAGGGPSSGGGAENEVKPTTKLTAEETSRAKDRAPLDRNGVLLCWGHLYAALDVTSKAANDPTRTFEVLLRLWTPASRCNFYDVEA